MFCGVGGFSSGFQEAGFDVLVGIDNWKTSLNTFKNNHKKSLIINSDIRKIQNSFFSNYKNIDVVIGGPPCQGFSMSGKRDVLDSRNNLFLEMLRAVRYINPKIFVIENVVGLLSMKSVSGKLIKDEILNSFTELGYFVKYKVMDASNYGVPQTRKRVIFVGSKDDKFQFPSKKSEIITVGESLGNIPDVNKNFYDEPYNDYQYQMSGKIKEIHNHKAMNHNEDVRKRISLVPQGGNWKDIPEKYYNVGGNHSNNYRRLDPKKPSITLKHATKSMIIHPFFNRVITAREVARLQSFNDDFIFSGTTHEQHQQLANAVPPFLGKEIANTIKEYL